MESNLAEQQAASFRSSKTRTLEDTPDKGYEDFHEFVSVSVSDRPATLTLLLDLTSSIHVLLCDG